MFNNKKQFKSPSSASKLIFSISLLLAILLFQDLQAQTFTRRNSPYSRYGIGDMYSTQFLPGLSTAGAFSATYNSAWDFSISNPASLGQIQSTTFDIGVFYKHSQLREKSTGLSGAANDGNISFLSIAFPITRSWEVERDTLRRGVPIQWGMSFSLLPHSTTAYDVRVIRNLTDIGNVQYKYTGEGTRFRANWGNGIRYKGLSAGANIGVLFGTINDKTTITFLDSAYTYAFSNRIQTEENTIGLLWDLGLQYELKFKTPGRTPEGKQKSRSGLVFGAYIGGSNNMRVLAKELEFRFGGAYATDTLVNTEDVKANMQLPLTVGGGIAYNYGTKWKLGANYESSLWNSFSYSERPISVANSYQVALGAEFTPDFLDFSNYFNRIRYRAGIYYGKDPRIVGSGVTAYQLTKYGITFGLGLPVKPLKSNTLGHIQVGFEFGYLGNNNLINEYFFQTNLAFSLNDGSWFRRYKFR